MPNDETQLRTPLGDSKLEDEPAASATSPPMSPGSPVSRTWIVMGGLALFFGLVMGLVMSSLGK
jgi:hypothetical protein